MRVLVSGLVALVACGRGGFDELDAIDATELAHVTVAPGWTKAVYVDFSADFTYNLADFIDGDAGEFTVDNQPRGIAVLGAPFAEILAIGAGRSIIELSTTRYIAHDFGMHPPNGSPADDFSGMAFVADIPSVGPRIVVGSSSPGGGDGIYHVNVMWSIARDMTNNNVRAFMWDTAGAVVGTPDNFVGTGGGMVRRSNMAVSVLAGDIRSLVTIPGGVVVARELVENDVRLIRASWTGTVFTEAELAVHQSIVFANGDRPSTALAWAVFDRASLVEVAADGTASPIATSDDPAFTWADATVPVIGHALAPARSIYVLESNRALDVDRVLVFTQT